MTRDRGYAFAVAAFTAAVAAVGIMAFASLATTVTVEESAPPADQTEASTVTDSIEKRRSSSIAQEQGWEVVVRIAIPVLLVAAAPLLTPIGRRGRVLRLVSTILLFAGVVVGAMSVGIFLLPAAILMLIAAVRGGNRPV